MTIIRTAVLSLLLVAGITGIANLAAQSAGDDVAIVVNRANTTDGLTSLQLRKIVLGQEAKWPTGKKIAVIMTAPGQPERNALLKIICNMRETDFTLYFMHASFNGESGDLPKNGVSGSQVRQLVAGNPNAIGIIKASQVDDSVKVLPIDGSKPGQSAYKLRIP